MYEFVFYACILAFAVWQLYRCFRQRARQIEDYETQKMVMMARHAYERARLRVHLDAIREELSHSYMHDNVSDSKHADHRD